MERITEKVERWKLLADLFFKDDKKVYIRDAQDNIYFCKIVLVGEDIICVDCFGPKQREGKRENIYWINIIKFDEYKEIGK